MQPFYMEQARSVSGWKPEDDELVAGAKRLGSNALLGRRPPVFSSTSV